MSRHKAGIVVATLFVVLLTAYRSQGQPLTVPEKTNFESTSTVADVRAFFQDLQSDYPQHVILSTIGTTLEGRPIPLVILGNPALASPQQTRKPSVLLVANIHAGEVEGKEALQMLSRDMLKNNDPALSAFNILIVPVFNVDGNERIDPTHRIYQQVKNGVGVRTNALNMDLNRDFIKLESPEDRALVQLFDEWQPLVYVDCHTTNGSHHVEPLTWTWGGNPNGSTPVHQYVYSKLMPWLNDYALKTHQIEAIPYGNFDNPVSPKEWDLFSNRLVYGVSYFGIKGTFSFLNENYAYADFPTRIKACYAFLDGLLQFSLTHRNEMMSLVDQFRNQPDVDFWDHLTAKAFPEKIRIKGFRTYRTDSGKLVVTKDRKDYALDFMGDYSGTHRKLTGAYVFPVAMRSLKQKLEAHGIQVYQLSEQTRIQAHIFHITRIEYGAKPFQGHIMMTSVEGKWRSDMTSFQPDVYVVPIDVTQPYRQLAAILLEPESEDALFRYGFWNTMIYPSQWRNIPGDYPVFRIDTTDKLKMRVCHEND